VRRSALLLLLLLSTLAVPAFAQTDVFLLGFTGFDYQDPNPDPNTYLAVGEGYKALGFVTSFGPVGSPLSGSVDMTANQYTFYYYDLTVQASFFDGTSLEVRFANPGRARFYEDSRSVGTSGDYGQYPPNATAPATFTDGTMILGGRIDDFILSYDYGINQGSFVGQLRFDEGSMLSLIPAGQRGGWTIAGLVGPPNPTVPKGYDHQISGECHIPGPTPAQHRTWGAIKALYR
jgi:hypothetical protein